MASSSNQQQTLISPHRVLLSWKDLSVTIPRSNGQPRHLLQNVSGYAEPGCLVAIMGPSGCGKTTLLNALAGRLGTASMDSGEILANGRRQRLSYGNSAYVTQDDSLIATLTVYETMVYSAHLQLPGYISPFERQHRVQRSIREMGLQNCANTRVGGWYICGLSGGEKRLLSIAIETLKQPPLLFLDEPTSGLDSAAAFHVVKRLCTLAKSGRTLLISIHQPSSEVFELFHHLCLLSAGQTVYFGERVNAQQFFEDAGFPCPSFRNPADHFLWIINSAFEEVPKQPNGIDCGFYVMTFVRYLIAGILQDGIGKTWLTKDWFQHEEVCKLRTELHQWCMKCLGEVSLYERLAEMNTSGGFCITNSSSANGLLPAEVDVPNHSLVNKPACLVELSSQWNFSGRLSCQLHRHFKDNVVCLHDGEMVGWNAMETGQSGLNSHNGVLANLHSGVAYSHNGVATGVKKHFWRWVPQPS